jgi:hypothetical protein
VAIVRAERDPDPDAAVALALRGQDLARADAPEVAGADQLGEVRVAPVGVADAELGQGGHGGQCRVGQQRPDDRACTVRADEDVAVGAVAAIERQPEASVRSGGRRDEPALPGHRVVGERVEQKITQSAPIDLGTPGE